MEEEQNLSESEPGTEPEADPTDPADPETDTGTETAGGDGSSASEPEAEDTLDEQLLATLIAQEIVKTQPTFEVIEAENGSEIGEFRIIHSATLGDLVVSILLMIVIAIFLLRWFFKAVWTGR